MLTGSQVWSDGPSHLSSQGGKCASAPGVFFDMIVKQGHLKTHIESVQVKVEYIHVIFVNIKLQGRDIWRLILNQFMRKLDILVIFVNIKLHYWEVWEDILNQSIRNHSLS